MFATAAMINSNAVSLVTLTKRVMSLLDNLCQFTERNMPMPLSKENKETLECAVRIKDAIKTLPATPPMFNLDKESTEDYLINILVEAPQFIQWVSDIETHIEVNEVVTGGRELNATIEIPAGDMFKNAPWFGTHIDMDATRIAYQEFVLNKLSDSDFYSSIWGEFVEVKVTLDPGEGDTYLIKCPGYAEDYIGEDVGVWIEDAIRELTEDDIVKIVQESRESKWWLNKSQVYQDEEIIKEVGGIKYKARVVGDCVPDDFYDDGMTPAAKKAFNDGDWSYVGIELFKLDEDGDESDVLDSLFGLTNEREYVLETMDLMISELQ